MKKTVTYEADYCDFCTEKSAYRNCFGCGRIACDDCRDHQLKGFSCYLYGDPNSFYLCQQCEANPAGRIPKGDLTDLYNLLIQVERYRREKNGFDQDFTPRWEELESKVNTLRDKIRS